MLASLPIGPLVVCVATLRHNQAPATPKASTKPYSACGRNLDSTVFPEKPAMFNATRLVFYYAISPVHMGAGSAIGAIDSPIQREVHTLHPMFSGSGLKGALRHHLNHAWPRAADPKKAGGTLPNPTIARIFGPDTAASDYAGALSLSDAQVVALPVRSLKNGFAYVTSPLALARLARLAQQAGIAVDWTIPAVNVDQIVVSPGSTLLSGQQLVLEAFEFSAREDNELAKVAAWLAQHALGGEGQDFFADKLKTDLVLLRDTDFSHFARHAMVIEPHVRINDESGTADDGGLFYVENLPPETLMVGLAQATVERFKRDSRKEGAEALLTAADVLGLVFDDDSCPQGCDGMSGSLLQIGGDATTGRGLVLLHTAR